MKKLHLGALHKADPTKVTIVSIMDDISIIGKDAEALQASMQLGEGAPKFRFKWSPTKDTILKRLGHASEALSKFCVDHKTTLVTSAITHGVPFGPNNSTVAALLLRHVKKTLEPLFEACRHASMPSQQAFRILTLSVQGFSEHFMKIICPEASMPALQWIDNETTSTVHKILEISDEETSEMLSLQLRLPIPLGGAGLYSRVETGPAVWLASIACNAESLLAKLPKAETGLDSRLNTDIASAVRLLHAAHIYPKHLTNTMKTPQIFLSYYAKHHTLARKLRQTLLNTNHTATHARLKESVSHSFHHSGRVASLEEPHTNLPFAANGAHTHNTLTHNEYVTAWRLRLGLSPRPSNITPHTCTCGFQLTLLPHNVTTHNKPLLHNHPLWCVKLRRTAATRAHDKVLRTVIRHMRKAGLVVTMEPRPAYIRGQPSRERLKPDLFATGDNLILYADVSMHYAGCPSQINRFKNRKGIYSILKDRKERKRKKYAELSTKHRAKFFGLAITRYGVMVKDFLDLVERVCTYAEVHSIKMFGRDGLTDKQVFLEEIQVAVLKGNHDMFRECAYRAQRSNKV
jgi:hypothetical protein